MGLRSWVQDRARVLEVVYHLTERLFSRLDPFFERSRKMPRYGEGIHHLQPMVDWQLEDTSAWINLITGADHHTSTGI